MRWTEGQGRTAADRRGLARGAGLPVVTLALALAAGCQQSAPRPSPSSLDCLLGPDSGRPECQNLDDDPERCVQAGGIFDDQSQRCLQ